MVPEGWGEVAYEDVCAVNRANVSTSTPADHEITYLDISAIPELGRISGSLESYCFGDAPSRARRVVQDGDVVVSTVRPYLRAFARIADPPPNLVASTGFAVLTPRDSVTSEFLFQTVCSQEFLAQLEAKMVGSNYPAVNKADVASATLLLPPLPEQRKIAAILSGVDDAIAATRKVMEQTKRVKQGLLQTLMTRGIGHTRFKKTEIGELPAAWEVQEVQILAAVGYGVTVNQQRRESQERVPLLTVAAHDPDEGWRAERVGEIGVLEGDREKYAAEPGDVLLVEGNGNPDLLGRPLIWDGQIDGALHQNHLIRVRPVEIESEWVALALSSPAARRQVRANAKSSSGLYTINSTVVKETSLPVAPPAERREIICAVHSHDEAIAEAASAVSALLRLNRGLLQDLLTGRVRVQPD